MRVLQLATFRAGTSPASPPAPYVSIRQHTPAHVSIRQHTSAHVSTRQHTPAHVSIRQPTSAYASTREHLIGSSGVVNALAGGLAGRLRLARTPPEAQLVITSSSTCPPLAYVSMRQHTSAYVSVRQRTSAYRSAPPARRLRVESACRFYCRYTPLLSRWHAR
jgi:hypothetical protein